MNGMINQYYVPEILLYTIKRQSGADIMSRLITAITFLLVASNASGQYHDEIYEKVIDPCYLYMAEDIDEVEGISNKERLFDHLKRIEELIILERVISIGNIVTNLNPEDRLKVYELGLSLCIAEYESCE